MWLVLSELFTLQLYFLVCSFCSWNKHPSFWFATFNVINHAFFQNLKEKCKNALAPCYAVKHHRFPTRLNRKASPGLFILQADWSVPGLAVGWHLRTCFSFFPRLTLFPEAFTFLFCFSEMYHSAVPRVYVEETLFQIIALSGKIFIYFPDLMDNVAE